MHWRFGTNREQLREQHELTQEIGNAITSMPITEPIDEDELESELNQMEQEKVDETMLRGGPVPVGDSIGKMPAVDAGPGELFFSALDLSRSSELCGWGRYGEKFDTDSGYSDRAEESGAGRRRGGRTAETSGGDGDVGRRLTAADDDS